MSSIAKGLINGYLQTVSRWGVESSQNLNQKLVLLQIVIIWNFLALVLFKHIFVFNPFVCEICCKYLFLGLLLCVGMEST
jgi:hypothetical protein